MKRMIRLIEVTRGKSEYHLIFKGYVPMLDNSRLYYFDYIGTEIETTNAALTDFAKENLANALYEDFGHGKFDMKTVNKTFGDGKEYLINFWDDKS